MNDREREERAIWKLHQAGECVRRQAGREGKIKAESRELKSATTWLRVLIFHQKLFALCFPSRSSRRSPMPSTPIIGLGGRLRRARSRTVPVYVLMAGDGRCSLRQGVLRQWHPNILMIIDYPVSKSDGTYQWSLTGVRSQQLAAGRSTITGSGNAAPGGRKPSVLFGTLPQTGSYAEPVGSKTG